MKEHHPRILLVAIANSVHTARWLKQIASQPWEIHFFPSEPCNYPELHREIKQLSNIRIHNVPAGSFNLLLRRGWRALVRTFREWLSARSDKKPSFRSEPGFPAKDQVRKLKKLISRIHPDVVHSLETQRAGYLTLAAKQMAESQKFPKWIHTNWGSDIYLFGKLNEHKERIRAVLQACDYYSCECHRDVSLAKEFGFSGVTMPVFPNTGGFDLKTADALRSPGPVSSRKTVLLKGYQHWAGRALYGLTALYRCRDILKDYSVVIYLASPDVQLAARLFSLETGIDVRFIPLDSSHEAILTAHGQARLSIGLSISDAISTSFLEALVMGSFPIQSWTSCANEWVVDGETGMLVSPDDPAAIEAAIRRALLDDVLVDEAERINRNLVREKLEYEAVRAQAISLYQKALQ